jgi:leucyl-tRNA synthetase
MAVPAHDERDFEFANKFGLPIKYVIAPKMTDHNNPHVEGKELVFREGIMAIVKNPKDGKVINLKWKKQPWTTFVMGGIENNEDIVEAAKREIYEETGYKNLKFMRLLGGPVYTEFFAAHKDVNRLALTWQVLFELENDDKDELSSEESAIHEVIWVDPDTLKPEDLSHAEAGLVLERLKEGESVYTDPGLMLNSGIFNRNDSESVKKEIIQAVGGEMKTSYKLRDWVFSRQRYWGEPIPVIHCDKCGIVPVPESDLPVTLPEVDKYEPTDTGESPLASIDSWVNVRCPKCGGEAKRETDTMPNWAGSSWYFLRYADPHNDKAFASRKNLDHWMQVDWYNGGMEHTTLHLLYSRFWNKFLFDIGLVPTTEPYAKRTSHGLILAQGGAKMSKSVGNVVNPDSIVEAYGADTLRLYEMFMGPFEQAISWSEEALVGPRRFIEKVWKLQAKISEDHKLSIESEISLNQTIKKISTDIEMLGFNTAVSGLMIFTNELEKRDSISRLEYETLLLLLSPFIPHVSEELWRALGHEASISIEAWPAFDPQKLVSEEVTIAVQVNGKSRATFKASSSALEEELAFLAKNLPEIKKWLNGAEPKRVIVVVGKVVNLVL